MYLGHAVSSPRFRLNTLRNIVYHLLQGVTARIVHIEERALEAWKASAGAGAATHALFCAFF